MLIDRPILHSIYLIVNKDLISCILLYSVSYPFDRCILNVTGNLCSLLSCFYFIRIMYLVISLLDLFLCLIYKYILHSVLICLQIKILSSCIFYFISFHINISLFSEYLFSEYSSDVKTPTYCLFSQRR